ncbi:MAG: universal stress protein [Rhizobiales bacterium]|nr:universal stress protein [Hyphomicrobiales bacterium]
MYSKVLLPIDLTDTTLATSAIDTALRVVGNSGGSIRIINVLPMTPVMLAEFVPPDFDRQQQKSSEEALATVAMETRLDPSRISTVVRQGGVYQEILEEARTWGADLIIMSAKRSGRGAVRSYFLGSHTGHVVRYAECSVLVVRN